MNTCILLLVLWILLQLYKIHCIYLKRYSSINQRSITEIPHKQIRYIYKTKNERRQLLDDLLKDIGILIIWCYNNNFPNKESADRLLSNWKMIQINETTYRDHVAYVIDKNRKFYLCASTTKGKNEDPNTMRFVVLHELAHMMSVSYGHTEEFSHNFLQLIRAAVHLGLYVPVNYSTSPVTYCGTKISHTPCENASCG